VSGSGINWAICKSAPISRQITTPAPYHSVFTGRVPFLPPNRVKALKALRCSHGHIIHRQDKTMSVDGLRCILYARIYILYIPYMRTYRRHGIHRGDSDVAESTATIRSTPNTRLCRPSRVHTTTGISIGSDVFARFRLCPTDTETDTHAGTHTPRYVGNNRPRLMLRIATRPNDTHINH